MREKIQSFGRALSAMVMPNIGAFIAWGLITAIFIPGGWWPNEHVATLVSPMLKYLLPLLIAYTAGKNVGGVRGAVAAAVATMGVIIGSDTPMFLGAMIVGPVAGWCIKKFDRLIEGKVGADDMVDERGGGRTSGHEVPVDVSGEGEGPSSFASRRDGIGYALPVRGEDGRRDPYQPW